MNELADFGGEYYKFLVKSSHRRERYAEIYSLRHTYVHLYPLSISFTG